VFSRIKEACKRFKRNFKIKELQDKWYDYFAQYLKDKINIERNIKNGK
jgi:hypothetical protein